MIQSVSVGPATEADRLELQQFICGDESEVFVSEVHRYVRRRMLDDFLFPSDPSADLRTLVFRAEPGHRLVAVAAHQRNFRAVGPTGEPLPGSELTLIAVSLAVQGDRVGPDSLFRIVLRSALEDVRRADRGPHVGALVHLENGEMLGILRSSGAFNEIELGSMPYSYFDTEL